MPEQEPATFEQALERLEAIVHELEEGRAGLDDSLARYEEGVGLLKRCYAVLQTAEQRVALLTGVDDEGHPVTEPFDVAETAAPRAAAPSTRQATARTAPDGGPEECTPAHDEENDTDAPRLF